MSVGGWPTGYPLVRCLFKLNTQQLAARVRRRRFTGHRAQAQELDSPKRLSQVLIRKSRTMALILFLCDWNGPFSFCGKRARNATRPLAPDPKCYIHLIKIVATIMKHWALIALLFILSAGSGEGTMYLYGGSDAYGQGLSYPGYSSPLSLTSFVAGNNTTAVSPVFSPIRSGSLCGSTPSR